MSSARLLSSQPGLEEQAAAAGLHICAPSPFLFLHLMLEEKGYTKELFLMVQKGEWSHFGLLGPSCAPLLSEVLVCLRGEGELFSSSAASLAALASAVRAMKKTVHPSVFLMDMLACCRHWEGNQPSPGQNPVTHEEFARVGNAIYVVSCCLRTETAWLERNIGTFFS